MTHDEIYEGRVARDERNYNSDISNYSKTSNPIFLDDELLAEIGDNTERTNKALRAVVELHNQGNTGECGDEGCCGGYTPDICGYCHDEYPCDTIKAIERELR